MQKVRHTTLGPFLTLEDGQTGWESTDAHVVTGHNPDALPSIDATEEVGLGDTVISSAISVTTVDDPDAIDNVFPLTVRLISGGGSLPKLDVNADGLWSPERAAISGDSIRLQVVASDDPLDPTVVRLYAPGSSIDWSVTTADVDPDVAAIVAATSLVDSGEITAVTDFVLGLKSASLWSKFIALYGFVGGTAAAHKINWVNTADDDAAYRLTFNGTWTHSAAGIQGDGASAYARTHYTQSSTTSAAIGAYSPDVGPRGGGGNPLLDDYAIAASNAGFSNMTTCSPRTQGNKVCFFYGTNTYSPGANTSDGSGLVVTNRNGGTATECYQNGTMIHTQNDTVTLCSFEYYIGALNKGGTPDNFTDRPLSLIFISTGLDATENANLDTLVQAYQTALGRHA